MTTEVVLALDVGGTSLKGAVVDSQGRAILSETVATADSGTESLERVRALLLGLQLRAKSAGHEVIAAGVATPGNLEPETGVVIVASILRWTNLELGSILGADLGVPVVIDHDVRTAGLAESLFGASTGTAHSVLVAIGTGLAACLVSSGQSIADASSSAGELGLIPAHPHGELCTCGQRGCLEVYMSGAGLARRYQAIVGTPRSAAEIVDRLSMDPRAAQVWADGVEALALGLTTITMLLDPAVIVLSGGVSQAADALVLPLRAQLAASLTWRKAPPVDISILGTHGGRIGASVLAFRAANRPDIPTHWAIENLLPSA